MSNTRRAKAITGSPDAEPCRSMPGARSFRRGAGLERRHRQEGMDPQLREESQTGAPCWPPPAAGVQRWDQRSQDPRFRATTGKLLWEFPTNSGILAPPTSFTVDGKQYIAVHAGWGGDSRGVQAN